MKKLFSLTAAGLLSFAAVAQQARQSIVRADEAANAMQKTATPPLSAASRIEPTRRNTAKVTATPFYTETFGSGASSATKLPTGWTATKPSNVNGNWKWTNQSATGSFNIGPINSTSKSDGWMIYDSDSIGDLTPTTLPISGSLISPSISCSGHSSVLAVFQSYFRKFRDSTYLDVSNDGGTNWTSYQVLENNTMGDNTTNTNNPTMVRINITATAANQSNVKLRFRYEDNVYAGGTFNWLVDDLALSELDPVELGIANSGMFQYNGSGNRYPSKFSLFSNIPIQFVDSLLPVTHLTNNGLSAQSNIVHNVRVFLGNTQVYNQNHTYAGVPPNTNPTFADIDSIVDWDIEPDYKPTATGAYTAAFSINQTNDAYRINDIDTARFNVTDTMYTTYGNTVTGGYYLHRPTAQGELSIQLGSRFDIPPGHKDTLTSVSVSYSSGTTVGVNTVVQLYKVTGSTTLIWNPITTMKQKTLDASSISTATTRVWTDYTPITTGGITPFILDSGVYAVVVKTIAAPATSTVLLTAASPINADPGIGGYYGHYDTSNNQASFTFAATSGIATGITAVPLMRINFGKPVTGPGPGSVGTISGVTVGNAYPNPANNTLNIPVSVTSGKSINISLSNMMGQTIRTQTLGNMSAGQSKTAVFNTSDLAAGMYMYTVESNGERVTNRVVVAH